MKLLTPLGRFVFCLSLIAFGLLNLISYDFIPGLEPVPPWVPLRSLFACLSGSALIVVGALIAAHRKRLPAAMCLAGLFAVSLLLLHLPRLVSHPANGGAWTVAFETIAFLGIALLLASPVEESTDRRQKPGSSLRQIAGRFCLGISMPAFGVLHFLYPAYVANAIPAWIPWHWFWAYFIGVVFCLAGVSLVSRLQAGMTSLLLGCMFGIWVIILHAPRVAANPQVPAEWTSLFVALAISGGAFYLAGTLIMARPGVHPTHAQVPSGLRGSGASR